MFTSPVAIRIGFAPDGIVRGKPALRAYWTAALARNPDLHFKVTATYSGVRTIVIAYRNQAGEARVEILTFDQGLVVEGRGLFAA